MAQVFICQHCRKLVDMKKDYVVTQEHYQDKPKMVEHSDCHEKMLRESRSP